MSISVTCKEATIIAVFNAGISICVSDSDKIIVTWSKDRTYEVPDLRREVGSQSRYHHPTVGCCGPTKYEYPHCSAARESLPRLQSCKPHPTFYSMSSHVNYPHGVTISPISLSPLSFVFHSFNLNLNFNK